MDRSRIGIYAGSFDPVHAGHIDFALKAIDTAGLERVYFLPERRPRHKPEVEHFGHRSAMIARAIRPHAKLSLLELPDIYFDISKTLPKLQKEFAGAGLVMLMGSDVAATLGAWPDIGKLLASCELAIGVRAGQSEAGITASLRALPLRPKYTLIRSASAQISSRTIRQAIRGNIQAAGLLSSVYRYARRNWLYVSLPSK